MAGLFQPILQDTGSGRVSPTGVERPSSELQVAPAIANAVSGVLTMFGEQKKAKSKADAQLAQDKTLSNYKRQLLQISEMGRTSKVSTSALMTKKTTLTANLLKTNPELHEDISKISAEFGKTAGFGKVVAEGTEEEKQQATNVKNASSAGYITPNMSEEDARTGLDSYLRIKKGSAELDYLSKQQSVDAATKKNESQKVITKMLRGSTQDYNLKAKSVTFDYERGVIDATTAKERLDSLLLPFTDLTRTLGPNAGEDFISQQMSSINSIHKNSLEFISGKFSLDALTNKNNSRIKIQESEIMEDPYARRVIAISNLLGTNGSAALTKANSKLVNTELGKMLGVTVDEEGDIEFPDPTTKSKEGKEAKVDAYSVLLKSINDYNTGSTELTEEATEELATAINRMAKGIDVYQLSVDSPKDLKDIVTFFAKPSTGEYIQKNGGMLQENLNLAKNVVQEKYVNVIGKLVREELFSAQIINEESYGRDVKLNRGAPLMDYINVDNNSGSIGFSLEAGKVSGLSVADQGRVRSQVRELNRKINPIVNEMTRIGAHMEGHTNYEKHLNNNLESLLGLTESKKEEVQQKPEVTTDDSIEATASKGELKIGGLKEKGFTKEQVLDVLDNLGLTDNGNKSKLIKEIDKVYSD